MLKFIFLLLAMSCGAMGAYLHDISYGNAALLWIVLYEIDNIKTHLGKKFNINVINNAGIGEGKEPDTKRPES